MSYRDLIVAGDAPPFEFIDPPFNRNAPDVAKYPAEVTGYHLLECMRRRLGWPSYEGRRLFDFGCGVRFARTIHNLKLPLSLYAGVDVNAEVIEWLQEHLKSPRFRFEHLDVSNALYNPAGSTTATVDALSQLGLGGIDAVCMFSVVTHQSPEEASLTFAQVRRVVEAGGRLYFTALTDDGIDSYREADPASPGLLSTYHPAVVLELATAAGWRVESIHPPANLQQTAFVCRAV